MIWLIITAAIALGGLAYSGWQHGFYDCRVEEYIIGGLAACYLIFLIIGRLCRKVVMKDMGCDPLDKVDFDPIERKDMFGISIDLGKLWRWLKRLRKRRAKYVASTD